MARLKHILHACPHCGKETKMELIGEMEGVPEKVWLRCTKCRHAYQFSLSSVKKNEETEHARVEMKDCLEYSPEKTYSVGQAIFHAEWNDVGKVLSKKKTSGGNQAIIVAFEKLGERKLIENFLPEQSEDLSAALSEKKETEDQTVSPLDNVNEIKNENTE